MTSTVAVGQGHAVDWTPGVGGDKVEVELTLQPLRDDLHVQQAQETAAEAKAQGDGGFRLKGQRGVVELAASPVRRAGLG